MFFLGSGQFNPYQFYGTHRTDDLEYGKDIFEKNLKKYDRIYTPDSLSVLYHKEIVLDRMKITHAQKRYKQRAFSLVHGLYIIAKLIELNRLSTFANLFTIREGTTTYGVLVKYQNNAWTIQPIDPDMLPTAIHRLPMILLPEKALIHKGTFIFTAPH